MRVLLIAICLSLSVPALAQSGPGETDAETRAREAFKEGVEAQKNGEYSVATERYLEAYELLPRPALLFNIAIALHLDGEYERALDYYNRYIKEDPRGPGAADARIAIDELEQIVAEREPEATEPAEPEEPEEPEESSAPEEATTPPGADLSVATESPSHFAKSPYLWGGIAVGCMAFSVIWGLQARGDQNELDKLVANSSDHNYDEFAETRDRGRRRALLANVFGGLALASGGVAVYFHLSRDDGQSSGGTVARSQFAAGARVAF